METYTDRFSVYEIRGRLPNGRVFRPIVLVPELDDAITMARGVLEGTPMQTVAIYDAIDGRMVWQNDKK